MGREDTYLFFQGRRCALLGTAVSKVADFDTAFTGSRITLDQLGLPSEAELTPVRMIFLAGATSRLGLIVRGPIEARTVAAQDIIPLPPAFFGNTAFSALLRVDAQQFALLLAAQALISN